jgi:hypothetical protein
VSLAGSVNTHQSFEILVNKNNMGKLIWQPWKEQTMFGVIGVPKGAVNVNGEIVKQQQYYVARHN